MPDSVARFTISIPPDLLATFDEVSASKGYMSRSEAVRDALRDYLISHEWGDDGEDHEVVGTVTLLYEHGHRGVTDALNERQHRHRDRIMSSMHLHLDEGNCLEVIVVRGARSEVAALADDLISLRGVKHGRLVCTSSGTGLL